MLDLIKFTNVSRDCVTRGWLVVCWMFMSWQHLRSYHDWYRLVIVYTHCDFIVVPTLGYQATGTMTWYPIESHYPYTELTSPCHILIMPSVWLGNDKYALLSHRFDSMRVRTQGFEFHNLPRWKTNAQLIWPLRLLVSVDCVTWMCHMSVSQVCVTLMYSMCMCPMSASRECVT